MSYENDPNHDLELQDSAHSTSSPVMVLASIATVCTVLVGVLPNIPGVPAWVAAVVAGLGAVATALYGLYAKGLVTPWKDVVSKMTPRGKVVSGPADPNNATGQQVELPEAA